MKVDAKKSNAMGTKQPKTRFAWNAGTSAKVQHMTISRGTESEQLQHITTPETYLVLTPFSFASFSRTAAGVRPSTWIQWRHGASKAAQSTWVVGAKANDILARGFAAPAMDLEGNTVSVDSFWS